MTIAGQGTTASPQTAQMEALAPPHPLREFWHNFSANRGALGGMIVIIGLVAIAFLADIIAPYAPSEQFRDALLTPPAWQEGG
ncbi:MAG: dipeptide ABC transporter permease DppC, partial [Alphaproteobacteria bacterium]